ncbi:MAG: aminotransferase class I/II-fold pyridoxal phosphate-dependent enzyme, partial [Idiomarina sp.]|nr:aminotransferase class I/II-fold pyridoxal phosphate-dependent enzyme [Idiomarina sp.]
NNTPVVTVPLRADDWQLDLEAIKANSDGVKVVFLCNPSNPLGNRLNPADIEAVITHFADQALVVVDEAYIEYAQQTAEQPVSFTQYFDRYDNLVVMRTLSKAFGLAGIRVGFTLAHDDVIQALVPVLAPYPLPDLSIQVATQALRAESLIEMRQNVIEAVGERERMATALGDMAFVNKVEASSTNFILFHVDDADALMTHCQQTGILLRNQSAQLGLNNCIRTTIGDPAENQQLIEVLRDYA